jgi:methylmalonyl-CoA mutase N-terminal domain/subunit
MALCCYDEAYTIPSEYAQRISLRTMQLLIEEMGLTDTVDPLGGSWYVETLTNQMRERIQQIMAQVDANGGIVRQVAAGEIQALVSAQAYKMVRAVQSGEFRKVGVNCYRLEGTEEAAVEMHPYREADARAQIESLNETRRRRDASAVRGALSNLRAAAGAGSNVMPAVTDAVKAYATVGEVTHELAAVYGRYREPVRF